MEAGTVLVVATGRYMLLSWHCALPLMQYEWFRKECYFLQGLDGDACIDSAYLVPEYRIDALIAVEGGKAFVVKTTM